MQAFVDDNGLGGFDHIHDTDGSVWAEFQILGQPSFAFINDDGSVESRPGALGLDDLTVKVNDLISS